MANEDHVELLRQGAEVWNNWRSKHPEEKVDLRGLNPTAERFKTVGPLVLADLSGMLLRPADLSDAVLRRVDLSGSDLSGVRIMDAYITGSSFRKANLAGALLARSRARDSNFDAADLSGADVTGADFDRCSLRKAVFHEANLGGALFRECVLEGADFERAWFYRTGLLDVDLSGAVHLDQVYHVGPSYLGTDTINRSKGGPSREFLAGCGLTDTLIQRLTSLAEEPPAYHSCFISYSARDEKIVGRLYPDLQRAGVRCWRFPESALWGEEAWGEIDRSIKAHDKLILVASQCSLRSGPVLREVERALQREDETHQPVLLPIRLDDFIFHGWEHPRAADVRAKTIGDFRGWAQPEKYTEALDRLLGCLSRNPSVGNPRS